jgi:outer membrane usher protein FimD/PapC
MASVPPSWNARFIFGTAYQHQDFDSGLTGRNSNVNVGVAVQHQQWGMFSAAIARGRTEQMAGANVDSQSYQSEYSRPLSKKHTLKFYYRQTRTVDCNTASESRDQSGGLQFALAQ